MTGVTFEQVSVVVVGPIKGHPDGDLWRWKVDIMVGGRVPVAGGDAPTQAEAWVQAADAGRAALDERAGL